ncbi:MAG: AAA family ATPase [Caldilineaceae bacterium]
MLVTPSPDKEERLDFDPRFGSIFPEIVKAIGGRYEFVEGKFCFRQGTYEERRAKNQHEYGDKIETIFASVRNSDLSNHMTAEGFRKIGILQQLLANGTLNPGISGPFFWDEPESNMNPKLMRLLVEILLELSRNGQQIILTTHDYVLLKWFDLLMDKDKEDNVRFHTLYHGSDSKKICIESTDDYLEINPNAIAGTFSSLTDYEISKSMGGLGK